MKRVGKVQLCLMPKLSGIGGMVSFQHKLEAGLAERGIPVCFDPRDPGCTAVLVVGGTKDLSGLWQARRRGLPVVQRLDGMNWLHRRRKTGLRHFLRAEYGNTLLAFIRRRLATGIVYQSQFSRSWWERVRGPLPIPNRVVYNGVNLEQYTPGGEVERPAAPFRILLVEGSLGGGYETGLETAVQMGETLHLSHGLPVEIWIAGKVSEALKAGWIKRSRIPLNFLGRVPAQQIPALDRSAHLLYSADLNAACPNSVVEALACGLPVVAFDTGALAELVPDTAGRLAAYGGNPWQLDPPDIGGLALAAADVLEHQEQYRSGARAQAEAVFGLDLMVTGYLEALVESP